VAHKHLQFLDLARQQPDKTSVRVRLGNWNEIYGHYAPEAAAAQSGRCLDCGNPYCEWKCPVHNYIPNWLKLVEEGRLFEAAELLHQTNSLPEICGRICPQDRLCEGDCTLNDGFGAVTIGSVEKYIADEAIAQGWRPDLSEVQDSGLSAAIVGAGPAGLACAHQLALFGHAVTVFEKQKKPGGLNEFGIAAYKTVDDFARREVEYILAVGGIEMRAGAELGRDITLEELRGEFDAVFLSPGLGGVNRAGVEGEGLDGVMDAVGFIAALRQAEDKSRIKVGKKIVVIGGGMTAIDIAVQTRKLGAEEVTIVYRRGPEDMRASRHEQDFARSNGVHFRCNARPARFIGEGTVRAAEFTVDGGETITLAADMVFTAIGQALGGGIPEGLSTADGRISVTADRATSIPGVWAGGDCVAGGDNLTVTAVEDGKVAARSIHRFLGGGHG